MTFPAIQSFWVGTDCISNQIIGGSVLMPYFVHVNKEGEDFLPRKNFNFQKLRYAISVSW